MRSRTCFPDLDPDGNETGRDETSREFPCVWRHTRRGHRQQRGECRALGGVSSKSKPLPYAPVPVRGVRAPVHVCVHACEI